MGLINTLAIITIMFNNFFNTYEAVTPPPKLKKDFKQEIQGLTEAEKDTIDPIWFTSASGNLDVDKPSSSTSDIVTTTDSSQVQLDSDSIQNQYVPQDSVSGAGPNPIVQDIINTGRSFVGSKYTSGGTSPQTGFDCSGFLQYIFKQHGVSIPRDTAGIFKAGKEVSINQVQPGDIICSKGSGASGRHVQMVSRVDPETNQIYVLEAKGRKYGIVEGPLRKKSSDIISVRRVLNYNSQDPFLSNQDIQKPAYVTDNSNKTHFSTRKEFAETLVKNYKQALLKHNLDPNYAYILTAQAAIESGWGNSQSGKYNFGGIKAGKNTPGTYKTTTDWSPTKGYYKNVAKFRDFESIQDYCNFKIDLLSGKRYNVFSQYGPSQPYSFVFHLLKKGYGGDNGGPGSVKYARDAESIYKSILKMTQ